MSLKDHGEDKAVTAQPRELLSLVEVTAALHQAVAARAKDRAAALLDELVQCWKRCNALQLLTSSRGDNRGIRTIHAKTHDFMSM